MRTATLRVCGSISSERIRRVAWAATDPERLVSLEGNRLNDGRRAKPDRRAADRIAMRALGWVEQVTTFYGGL